MKIYQCTASARKDVHVQVEAESKQEAANKAMKLFEENGALVLWESKDGMWTGPEEVEFDEELEVTGALDEGPPYWDAPEFIRVNSV